MLLSLSEMLLRILPGSDPLTAVNNMLNVAFSTAIFAIFKDPLFDNLEGRTADSYGLIEVI